MTPLHYIGEWLREALLLIPMGIVRALFVALPIVLILWVLSLPRTATTPPGDHGRPYENMKIYAVMALLIQVLIYSVL